MQLHSIDTGNFKLDGGAMFGVVPKTIWQKLVPADENNLCTWAMRCLLIEDGNRLILIDTGIGNKQSEKFFSHYHLHGNASLESSLQQKGFSTNDITDVVLTHLHFDHCGGAVKRQGDALVPAFANARFWSNEAHWQWATQPNDREKASFLGDNILPIQQSGQLQFWNDADHPLGENFGMKYMYGHTDAMMLPVIQYKGHTIVYMADLLPSVAHLPLPYVMGYDMFPLKTLQEKKLFLQEAVANNYILFFEHDAVHECCRLEDTEKGIRAKETFALSEL
ncbi:MAG: MBL fold metallo-hydrolase [Bacteroidetes bacterium]|nr:MAG: MBL fold metallo-hydrolase [Bacteroidota bacterium]TAE72646.1 MAG: MBL fold metallo-hydrolase [Bacteroidota bacterium]TAF92836.1 MAG: MBL fold metallo-hydrolase [Bacteroidota bacterium]